MSDGDATSDDSPPEGDGTDPSDDGASAAGGADPTVDALSIAGAREAGIEAAQQLLDHDVDGVVRVERADEGWRVLVEVVERSAVPSTQDILGRYEVLVDDGGTVLEYGLLERYRRGETREEL